MARTNRRWRTRRGVIAVFVAMSMIFILGMVAITLDGGGLLDRRRHAQATADAAAMAGACVLYREYPVNQGPTPTATLRPRRERLPPPTASPVTARLRP